MRASDKGGKRLLRLAEVEFVRRFQIHVLPTGIKRIRHYGVLASACKGVKLNAARAALGVPQPNSQAVESAQGFMARVAQMGVRLCPCCKVGLLQVTAVLRGQPRLPAPACAVAQQGRGGSARGAQDEQARSKAARRDKPLGSGSCSGSNSIVLPLRPESS